MKTVGMLLIFLTGVGCGVSSGMRLHRRVTFLDRIARWLFHMAEHIRHTAAPLCEVLRDMRSRTEFASLPFLSGDTREAVSTEIRRCRAVMALSEEDVALLCECVDDWGMADLEGEVSRFRRYGAMFEKRCAAAKEDAVRRGRLYVTLGICAGGAVALLLGG